MSAVFRGVHGNWQRSLLLLLDVKSFSRGEASLTQNLVEVLKRMKTRYVKQKRTYSVTAACYIYNHEKAIEKMTKVAESLNAQHWKSNIRLHIEPLTLSIGRRTYKAEVLVYQDRVRQTLALTVSQCPPLIPIILQNIPS